MADRRDLTVSKPNPLNARQEAFARSIAESRCRVGRLQARRLHFDARRRSGRQVERHIPAVTTRPFRSTRRRNAGLPLFRLEPCLRD